MDKLVNVAIDETLFIMVNKKLPYLGYETVEDLVKDAVRLRIEFLLQLT